MNTLKWIGVFVRGEEVCPLTIQAPIGERSAFHRSIARHVAERVRAGWRLVYEVYILTEE